LRMLVRAPPPILIREEPHGLASAGGAFDPVGPAASYQVVTAVVGTGEVKDGFLKAGRLSFHTSIMADPATLVNYIISQICTRTAYNSRNRDWGHTRCRVGRRRSTASLPLRVPCLLPSAELYCRARNGGFKFPRISSAGTHDYSGRQLRVVERILLNT